MGWEWKMRMQEILQQAQDRVLLRRRTFLPIGRDSVDEVRGLLLNNFFLL